MTPRTLDRLEASAYTVIALSVAVILLVWAAGCSQNPRHNYAVASQTVAASLFAVQDAEESAYRLGKVTPAQHMAFNKGMLNALLLGREFNTAVRAWEPGKPPPEQLPKLKEALFQLSTVAMIGFPDDVKAELQRLVAATYDAVLAVLLAAQGGA